MSNPSEEEVVPPLITKVPQTEEEVMQALQYSDDVTTNAMRGLARCRMKMGDTPEQAYEYALLQHIGIFEAQMRHNHEPVTPNDEPVTPNAEPVTPNDEPCKRSQNELR